MAYINEESSCNVRHSVSFSDDCPKMPQIVEESGVGFCDALGVPDADGTSCPESCHGSGHGYAMIVV